MSNGPKYQILADIIRKNIGDGIYSDGQALDTENDFAKKYDMSRQTVRQALGLLEAEGILERVRGSGTYVKHKRVVREKTYTIGVIVTYMSECIFPIILRGIESELAQNGYTMKLSATLNQVGNERSILKEYLKKPVDGLIVQGTRTNLPNPNISLYKDLSEMGIPYVFFNGYYPELEEAAYVVTDDRAAGKEAVRFLAKKGHKNIAGIFKMDEMQGVQRYHGYLDGLIEENLDIRDESIMWFSTEERKTMFNGEFGQKIITSLEDCTAIVCYSDQVAVGVFELFKNSGIKVPEDIAMVSFDNSFFSELNSVKLTSLSHPKEGIGSIAVKQLINMINGGRNEKTIIPMDLVEKEST